MTDLSRLDPVCALPQVPPSRGRELTSRVSQTRRSEALKPKTMLNSELVPVPYCTDCSPKVGRGHHLV